MIKILVPILTEEYKVWVYIGKRQELIKSAAKYIKKSEEDVKEFFKNNRGCTVNELYNGRHPLILIDTECDVFDGFATLAHEASHAMDFIEEYCGIKDEHGEIHAHGIASILRHGLKKLHKQLKKI